MAATDLASRGLLSTYSIPTESRRLLSAGLLNNPKISKDLPQEVHGFAERIRFTGSHLPAFPVNWRFAESVASLKALEACTVSALVKRKYNVDLTGAEIDTDHAQLFFLSTFLWQINPDSDNVITFGSDELDQLIPNYEMHNMTSRYRQCATNIYRTKDNRFFHLHASMNADATLESIGFPKDRSVTTWESAMQPFIEKLATIDAADMQHRATDIYRQAGVISESVESFRTSEHGIANAHVGLFEINHVMNASQTPCWWTPIPETSASRPLVGLKVVDLTRVIAAPAITRGLAELGASIMRITSPNLVDTSGLHIDLNWGKWECSLDLKTEEGRKQLRVLIQDADVVVQGYRPGVLDKYGFSQDDVVALVSQRPRGIISVRENCYGWHGPWSSRSGWQQISDACVGISARFGKAMGLEDDEPVTPVFPNSDYMTGIAGVIAILTALMRRAVDGGSYKVDLALNYYNQWLADSVGEYPREIWQNVWEKNNKPVFRCFHNMNYTIPRFMSMIRQNSNLFDPRFLEDRKCKALGVIVRTVKPIIKFDNEVELGYNVGTRGNGADKAQWPEDLMTEIVR